MYSTYRVLVMTDSLLSVCGLLLHFAIFPMFRFSKDYCKISDLLPPFFIQFQPNFILRMLVIREYRLLYFGAICQLKM